MRRHFSCVSPMQGTRATGDSSSPGSFRLRIRRTGRENAAIRSENTPVMNKPPGGCGRTYVRQGACIKSIVIRTIVSRRKREMTAASIKISR